jgi:hypothetical protein
VGCLGGRENKNAIAGFMKTDGGVSASGRSEGGWSVRAAFEPLHTGRCQAHDGAE